MKVTFNKTRKLLKIECEDVAFETPFEPHVVVDILNSIHALTRPDDGIKFEYFKEDGIWGFRSKTKKMAVTK